MPITHSANMREIPEMTELMIEPPMFLSASAQVIVPWMSPAMLPAIPSIAERITPPIVVATV